MPRPIGAIMWRVAVAGMITSSKAKGALDADEALDVLARRERHIRLSRPR